MRLKGALSAWDDRVGADTGKRAKKGLPMFMAGVTLHEPTCPPWQAERIWPWFAPAITGKKVGPTQQGLLRSKRFNLCKGRSKKEESLSSLKEAGFKSRTWRSSQREKKKRTAPLTWGKGIPM